MTTTATTTARRTGRPSGAGWPVAEIATGHDAMVTAPGALIELLDPPG